MWLFGIVGAYLFRRELIVLLMIWTAFAVPLYMCSPIAGEGEMREQIGREALFDIEVYEDSDRGGIWASVEVDNPTPFRITDVALECDALNDDGVDIVARTNSSDAQTIQPRSKQTIAVQFNRVAKWTPLDTFDVASCRIGYEPVDASEGRNDQWVQSSPI